jgi:GT2 family glycosyltransferase
VIIPTIGRLCELERTLAALAKASPRAGEIVVVDQSSDVEVATLVRRFESVGARRLQSKGRGVALAANEGLVDARHETIFFTDDDCTVEPDWIGVGVELMTKRPACIFTGQVLPQGNPANVPTTALSLVSRDYTGDPYCSVLVRSNMVAARSRLLEIGGFDERFETSAEDDDLCYRWVKSGGCLRYEPQLVVWHRDWRDSEAVKERYARYGQEQAAFYVKHLRSGDPRVLRFLARDLQGGFRAVVAATARRGDRQLDPRFSVARGVLQGLRANWRES